MKRMLNAVLSPIAASSRRFEPFWRWFIRPDSSMYPAFVRSRYGVHVGHGTTISPEARFYEFDFGLVVIGNDCALSGCQFVTHSIIDKQLERWGFEVPRASRIVVADGVAIGMGAKIQSPCYIGEGAIIGMDAIVTRNVPADAIVVGHNRVLPMTASEYRRSRITGARDEAHTTAFPGYRLLAGEPLVGPSRRPVFRH